MARSGESRCTTCIDSKDALMEPVNGKDNALNVVANIVAQDWLKNNGKDQAHASKSHF
jgi:hypothetical protein